MTAELACGAWWCRMHRVGGYELVCCEVYHMRQAVVHALIVILAL